MSYMAMKEGLQGQNGFRAGHVYVDEHDYNCANVKQIQDAQPDVDHIHKMTDSFVERVREAYNCAIREGIRVNSIVINENIVKVPETWIKTPSGGARMLPPMVCGLNVYLTEGELPENYSFALVEGPEHNTRLEAFESIGMEPDELRKAAELYRAMKDIMENT